MSNFEKTIDKQLLIEAICDYDYYTETQRKILRTIVQTSLEGICKVSISFISQKLGVSRTAVYKALKRFVQEGDIDFKEESNSRIRLIKINLESMKNIISIHLSKKNL